MSERKTDQQSVKLPTDLMKWLEQIAEETNTSVPEVIRAAIEHAQETKKKS